MGKLADKGTLAEEELNVSFNSYLVLYMLCFVKDKVAVVVLILMMFLSLPVSCHSETRTPI